MSFFHGKINPDQVPDTMSVKISGCMPESGGVGLSLNSENVVLELVPGGAAENSNNIIVGDRVVGCDGEQLKGSMLSAIILPLSVHELEIERSQCWAGFSVEGTDIDDDEEDDGMRAVKRTREVTVQKKGGKTGTEFCYSPDRAGLGVVKIAKVHERRWLPRSPAALLPRCPAVLLSCLRVRRPTLMTLRLTRSTRALTRRHRAS